MAQKRSETTRKHILEAALGCFSSKGYEATSVAEICEAAGVSKGAFYHHFATKQAVFLALLSDWLKGLESHLLSTPGGATSVPEIFSNMAEMSGSVFSAASGQLPMFLEFWVQAERDPMVWKATIEPYRHYQELFASMIAAGINEGSIRPVSPETAAKVVVALAVGLLLQSVLDPDAGDWGLVAKEGIELLMKGLRR